MNETQFVTSTYNWVDVTQDKRKTISSSCIYSSMWISHRLDPKHGTINQDLKQGSGLGVWTIESHTVNIGIISSPEVLS